jgi:hypothetical protein
MKHMTASLHLHHREKKPKDREAMLPPWLIERIRREKREDKPIQPQIPLEEDPIRKPTEKQNPDDKDRGAVEIQIFKS